MKSFLHYLVDHLTAIFVMTITGFFLGFLILFICILYMPDSAGIEKILAAITPTDFSDAEDFWIWFSILGAVLGAIMGAVLPHHIRRRFLLPLGFSIAGLLIALFFLFRVTDRFNFSPEIVWILLGLPFAFGGYLLGKWVRDCIGETF